MMMITDNTLLTLKKIYFHVTSQITANVDDWCMHLKLARINYVKHIGKMEPPQLPKLMS